MKSEIKDQQVIIHCGDKMDITSVPEQHELLITAIGYKKPIILEGKELTRIDSAGLQLILNFILAANKNNIHYEWVSPSDQLLKLADLLGLSGKLGLKAWKEV